MITITLMIMIILDLCNKHEYHFNDHDNVDDHFI